MASAADARPVRLGRSRRAPARRGAVVAAALLALLALPACYVVAPTTATRLAPGARMAVDVNDQGRTALGERIGPEIRRLGGMFVGESDGELELRVTDVTDLSGTRTTWSGEPIKLRREYVKDMYERKFSRGRTAIAAGAAVAAVIAFIASRSLFGLGGDEGGAGGDGNGGAQQ